VTVAVELPDAVRFLATPAQLRRYAAWFRPVQGLTVPARDVPGSVPLPRRFTASREVGLGSVQAMDQFSDATRTVRSPDLNCASGSSTRRGRRHPARPRPGTRRTSPGVATRIADLASTAGLRTLAGRGPGRVQRFGFRYVGYGGARLVEVTLAGRAGRRRRRAATPARAPAAAGAGIEQYHGHTPSSVTDRTARTASGSRGSSSSRPGSPGPPAAPAPTGRAYCSAPTRCAATPRG
jgi:hypothetical protein